jgi:hypothetical protein
LLLAALDVADRTADVLHPTNIAARSCNFIAIARFTRVRT